MRSKNATCSEDGRIKGLVLQRSREERRGESGRAKDYLEAIWRSRGLLLKLLLWPS